MTHRFRALIGLTAVLSIAACQKAPPGARTTSARLDYVNGEVSIDGVAVEAGATIKPTFAIETGAASNCGIIFDEKNILHVDENTEAYIDLAADVRNVEIRRGMIASALRKLSLVSAHEPERFRVSSPAAVAGVRGTVFLVRVEDDAKTYLCDCNGVLDIRDASGGNARKVEAAHHKAFRYTRSGAVVTSAEADLQYHTDQMMEMGAARIGETIDWRKVGR